MSDKSKKTIMDVVQEVETYFLKEGLSAREILMVLREIETDATITLMLAQKYTNEQNNDGEISVQSGKRDGSDNGK